ncbi:MAG: hypothetical protein KBT45_06310 [Bacteroidales bacterium]|nr:hypothetical protein [Candidatus Colimorpha pelethequi]
MNHSQQGRLFPSEVCVAVVVVFRSVGVGIMPFFAVDSLCYGMVGGSCGAVGTTRFEIKACCRIDFCFWKVRSTRNTVRFSFGRGFYRLYAINSNFVCGTFASEKTVKRMKKSVC